MASAINSRARKRPRTIARLGESLGAAVIRGPVPLLVLRLPQFERIAWRAGKRAARRLERTITEAFETAARRVLRSGDLTAHDAGSDAFVITMTAPSRMHGVPAAADCRAVLERVAAAMALSSDLRIETGWTLVRRFESESVSREIESALDRGSRERERYEFFAAVGHELRTPLTSIRGYLETLLDGEIDPALARRFLETSRREALRMGRLLEGMFEFSLLDLSGDGLARHACDLGLQIDLACEVVRPSAQARGMLVRRSAVAQAVVAIDADACQQLLVNLLDNAIKYGAGNGTVEIGVSLRDGDAIVSVDDDGPGIAAGERESIFGLRVRGTHAASRPGTGIGLAIVKMIAERAGGGVRVTESALGGARFEASLPKAESDKPLS